MKNPLLKKLLPHLTAIALFLVVSMLFAKPALEGNVLNQHDNVGWKGMAQNSFEYKKVHGHFPLWNPNLFSGMPNYQVAMEGKSVMPDMVKIMTLGLPKPINFFFLACICFYILCLALRVNPLVGMISAIAYSFATYNAVIVFAGHDTQMLATAFMPLLMAGLILIYEKNYWLGFALTTLGAYQQLGVNHLQVTYYFFLIAIFITIAYLVKWIQDKDWKHIGIAALLTLVAAGIAVMSNALILKTTSEYSKFTMRNGKDFQISGDSVITKKTTGLDTSYAFEYSLGKKETFTLLMPEAFGGGSTRPTSENSHVVSQLTKRGIDDATAQQVAQQMPRYWGDLPSTAGPQYLGVLICLMGLLGFFLVRHPARWGLLAATLMGIMMSWGKHFAGFNVFLFEHMPLYNKFRSPAFAQVIPQLTIGIIGALALQKLLFEERSKAWLQAHFKKVLYILGGVIAVAGLYYLSADFSSPIDKLILNGYTDKNGSDEMGRLIVSGLKADRQGLLGGQILRTILFAGVTLGILFMFLKSWIKPVLAAILILVITSLEITMESRQYLPDDSYVPADDYDNLNFAPTAIDQQILNDKDPNFRVFNLDADTYNDSRTSFYHKSVGGYHPAKLRTYQDMIEKYLMGRPNPGILNMLNAKYIIVSDPQSKQPGLIPNAQAYGNCWLVKYVKTVPTRADEIKELGLTNLKDTAIVQASALQKFVQPQWDSASTIRMAQFDNDAIEYEADCKGNSFAVFSEIYYPKGWNAYIDGKKADYVNANYILRGLAIPAGKHQVKFVFEPESVKQGRSLMFIGSILTLLALVGGIFMSWWQSRKTS